MRPERSPSHASQWLNPGGRLCQAHMSPLVQFELASANRIVFTASRGPMMGGMCNTTTVRVRKPIRPGIGARDAAGAACQVKYVNRTVPDSHAIAEFIDRHRLDERG